MRRLRVVLTGGTGFIGSRVLQRLLDPERTGRPVEVRALARTEPSSPAAPGLSWLPADLARPASLRGAGEGADVLVHLASRISGSEDECAAVNVHGTTALVEEARRCGVGRIVQLSTAAVYGPGPHRGIAVDEVVPAPVSPASRTRLRGERAAVAAGGTVLRPGLVTGAGDRWVVPALADLREHVPARWNGGRGLASMVDVDDLARLIVRLATTPKRPPGGTFHASHPRPVRNRDLMAALGDARVVPPAPAEDWPWEVCLRQLRRSRSGVSERQFELLAGDHWYASDDIWRMAGCPAGPGPLARLSAASAWYRAHLAERRGAPRA
ncbi:NAD(P)-dependent oxidoreductase [Streptomyces tricolor]|uniref:NAD(P)-dependent oxidoreductase n=1 Tax=Streptomyces tricolor TaxID=68277 RepID=A0ABS9JSL4_9ACTN|nr:NAD(P)-dependent oxidoreductase [Streptomyces tricolor]MCG0068562.1 NAD(P)-dependent oxidoreductase [Streptomyces tricolor]